MAFLLVVLFDGAAGFGHRSNLSSVCELEAARGLVEKAARSAAVESTTPQAPTLRLWVAVAQAGYFGGNAARHLTTSISIDGKPSCPGTGRRSTVTLQMAPTTRALRKRHRHHRHRHQHEQLLFRYANPAKPAERVVLDAVLCDGRKKLAKQRAVTRVVDAKSLKLCRSSATPPPMPPRSDPSALLALLEARTNAQILLAKATEELARRLGRRGTLCDHNRPCSARILPQCPDGCIARDANASFVFAHLEAAPPRRLDASQGLASRSAFQNSPSSTYGARTCPAAATRATRSRTNAAVCCTYTCSRRGGDDIASRPVQRPRFYGPVSRLTVVSRRPRRHSQPPRKAAKQCAQLWARNRSTAARSSGVATHFAAARRGAR